MYLFEYREEEISLSSGGQRFTCQQRIYYWNYEYS